MTRTFLWTWPAYLAVIATQTVSGLGWDGVKNSELLRRMQGTFDALVTMDRNLPHQQNLAVEPFGIVLIEAPSNRMVHLRPAPVRDGIATFRHRL